MKNFDQPKEGNFFGYENRIYKAIDVDLHTIDLEDLETDEVKVVMQSDLKYIPITGPGLSLLGFEIQFDGYEVLKDEKISDESKHPFSKKIVEEMKKQEGMFTDYFEPEKPNMVRKNCRYEYTLITGKKMKIGYPYNEDSNEEIFDHNGDRIYFLHQIQNIAEIDYDFILPIDMKKILRERGELKK